MAIVLGAMFVVLTIAIAGQAGTGIGLTDAGVGPRPARLVHPLQRRSSPASSWPGRCTPPTTPATCPVATRRARGSSGGRSSGCRWAPAGSRSSGLLVADKATEGGAVDTINTLLSGTPFAALAMLAIGIGTVAVNAMNDYTGSLSLQAAGIRVPRIVSALDRRGPRLPRDALAELRRPRRQDREHPAVPQLLDRAVGGRRPGRLAAAGRAGRRRAGSSTSPGCRAACSGWRRRSSASSCRCRSRPRRWAARSRTNTGPADQHDRGELPALRRPGVPRRVRRRVRRLLAGSRARGRRRPRTRRHRAPEAPVRRLDRPGRRPGRRTAASADRSGQRGGRWTTGSRPSVATWAAISAGGRDPQAVDLLGPLDQLLEGRRRATPGPRRTGGSSA